MKQNKTKKIPLGQTDIWKCFFFLHITAMIWSVALREATATHKHSQDWNVIIFNQIKHRIITITTLDSQTLLKKNVVVKLFDRWGSSLPDLHIRNSVVETQGDVPVCKKTFKR